VAGSFDEFSGLETTQCFRYARSGHSVARHFDHEFEDDFVNRLEQAPSNLPEFRSGRGVWATGSPRPRRSGSRPRPLCITLIYAERQEQPRVYCYDLETLDQEWPTGATRTWRSDRLKVRSRLTWNEAETWSSWFTSAASTSTPPCARP